MLPLSLFAHKNKPHNLKATNNSVKSLLVEPMDFSQINSDYLQSVKPIFKRSCFDCHSGSTRYPWYSKLPFIKSVIDADIKEGLTHLDLTQDFPFKSHATPKEDLEEILRVINESEMPPLRYRILHQSANINEEEKAIVRTRSEEHTSELQSH